MTEAPSMPPRAPRTFRRRLLVLCVVTIAAGGLAEAAFRAAKGALHRRWLGRWEHELYVPRPDRDFVYSLRPGVAHGVVSGSDISWQCNINSTGQRGPELLPERAGRRRVVVLGDSYTFGWAVADGETLPAALGRALEASSSAHEVDVPAPIEVVNAGVPGFNTSQEAAFLAEHWSVLRPDVVVLAFVMNDGEPSFVAPSPPHVVYHCAASWLLEDAKYHLNRALARERALFEVRLLTRRSYLAQFAEGAPERAVCLAGFDAIVSRCRAAGVPLLVGVLPDTTCPVGERYPYRVIHDMVRGWCADRGVACVDLVDALIGLAAPDRTVPGDGHPSAAANFAFAGAIAAPLRTLLAR